MPNDRPCPSCSGAKTVVDAYSGETRPCIVCERNAYEAWCDERRPMTRRVATLDERGRCCGRKPRPYKSKGHLFCCRCDATFDIRTTKQIANWAWRPDGDAFVAINPTAEIKRLESVGASHGKA